MREEIKSNLTLGANKDSVIDGFIRTALRSNRKKRYHFLRKQDVITVGSGGFSAALPSDYSVIEDVTLSYDGRRYTRQAKNFGLTDLMNLYQKFIPDASRASGRPQVAAIDASEANIELDKIADTSCFLNLVYYCQDVTLPQGNGDTSVWFSDGYDYIRASAQILYMRYHAQDAQYPADELGAYKQVLDNRTMFNSGANMI
jgi:hypothetical protein